MNLLEINVFILWFQSEFWNDFVAMKLLFSRINEERKCTISLQPGVHVSLESERGFISSQILLIGDRNEICGQIFSGFRTEHTCSVHLVDYEWGGRVVGSWRFPSGRVLFQISSCSFWIECFSEWKLCRFVNKMLQNNIYSLMTDYLTRVYRKGQGVMKWMQLV